MDLWQLINKLKQLSDIFYDNGVADIYTNSKIYEVLIAHQLGHHIINGHAYSYDAEDEYGNRYEYKHYKQSSSNYTWTFNDYTTRTIKRLHYVKDVYFVVIDDKDVFPRIKKIYIVSGKEVAEYLKAKDSSIQNHRKMINISANQITEFMSYEVINKNDKMLFNYEHSLRDFIFHELLNEIFVTANQIEKITEVRGLLTSNKLWELLVACELRHKINPDQKKHDAYDIKGRTYEYKVDIKPHWTFQDISNNVLHSYLNNEKIILAVVDKQAFVVKQIVSCQPKAIKEILEKKLNNKKEKTSEIRRLTASIGMKDINQMIETGDAEWIL